MSITLVGLITVGVVCAASPDEPQYTALKFVGFACTLAALYIIS